MDKNQDEFFLKETFKLAKKGMGWTNPNPIVGAVIVKNGHIIAKGYHKKFGGPHAEIEAINSAKTDLKGATLYTSLEPCCHFGKTLPCTDVIIKAGITKVVCPVLDPNPKVSGKGVAKLRKAGISVSFGTLEDQASSLNEAFFTFHKKGRPFVAIKFASSLDGKIATKTGDSKWITNEKAKEYARSLRSQYQAVLVGINTILRDDPHLGVRTRDKKDPLRIILDPSLKIPLNSQVLRDSNVLIVINSKASNEKINFLKQRGIPILKFSGRKILLQKLLIYLKEIEIISFLVEGGGKTLGNFIDKKLFDKIYAFYSPIIIGGEKAVNSIGGDGITRIREGIHIKNVSHKYFGDNFLLIGYK